MEWRTKSSLTLESVTADVKDQKESDHIFDKQGLLNKEFLPDRKTLRCEFYTVVLECLLKQISRVRYQISRE
jgi:hypothetical protein